MKLYRYSPIQSTEALYEAIKFVHEACHTLCKQSFDRYLPNVGNVGIFCHYEREYEFLTTLRKEMTVPAENADQKYFVLHEPIIFQASDDIPETTYTHLYIRKPDPYRHHVGDIDFYLSQEEYSVLKQSLTDGQQIEGARIFPRNDLDMIELFHPDIDALAYVSTHFMTQKVRVKQSDETNL